MINTNIRSLSVSTIKSSNSQTVKHKGAFLTVAWGSEFYTAIYKGNVYRQTYLKDLKKDIANGWACNDELTNDHEWLLPLQDDNIRAATPPPPPPPAPAARVLKSRDTKYSLEYTIGAEADYMRLYFDTIASFGSVTYLSKAGDIVATFRGTTAYIVKAAYLNREK